MSDFEVHIALNGRTRQVGLARSNRVRGKETILFEYDDAWLSEAPKGNPSDLFKKMAEKLNQDSSAFLIGNRFLWEGDGKQVVLVKAPD